jgi:hypothetical protein
MKYLSRKQAKQRIESGEWRILPREEIPKPRVDLVPEGEGGLTIPRIHFQWIDFCRVEGKSSKPGVLDHLVPLGRKGDLEWTHRWSMCFRRYGWSASADPKGEYGYGIASRIWPSGWDGGLTCTSTEQVIRESLVAHIALLDVPKDLKYHIAVRPLWDVLVEDALAKRWNGGSGPEFATYPILNPTGCLGDVLINGQEHLVGHSLS